jgi:uncharacterized protein with gpF-like domain
LIFTPMYKMYKDLFNDAIIQHTSIRSSFENFEDTGIYERYMLNGAQFSAAKNLAETKLMQAAVFDEDKQIKSFSQFSKDADEIADITQRTWLRTEYDTATKQAVNAELFNQMRADADLYPYWEYLETNSANPREDHLALVGLVFRIGDPDGDDCHPQNGFNCGCGSSTLDDRELNERGLNVLTNEQAKDYLMKDVDPQFRFNSADQGIMPKEGHSYFEVLPNANAGDYKLFGLPGAKDMPDTLDADINNRIAKIKEQAAGLVDEDEEKALAAHTAEMDALQQLMSDLRPKLFTQRFNNDVEGYAETAKQYNDAVLSHNRLADRITDLKNNYATRAAELLKNTNTAHLSITGTKNEFVLRGAGLFKKIVGDKTKLEGLTLRTKVVENRAGYSISEAKMNVKPHEKLSTVTHEMAHWLEHVDHDHFADIQDFYERRTAGNAVKKMADIKPGKGYGAHEIVKDDKFIEQYTGKLYLNKKIIGTFDKKSQYATEITSMWFTHALSDLKGFIEKDPEHFEYVYKLLNK